jgi:uncharacterized protein
MSVEQNSLITGLLLKVASRCNLNCDYCYVYQHSDQSWRNQPKLLSDETAQLVIERLAEYVSVTRPPEFSVVFHGGEPLLYGAKRLSELGLLLRERLEPTTQLDISLQTNGVLLDDDAIRDLSIANIGISVSLDGPRTAHDRHRLTHGGNSTFDETIEALARLGKSAKNLFRGVIAVIDPTNSPAETLEFFSKLDIPRLDFLLPDATHANPPPVLGGRSLQLSKRTSARFGQSALCTGHSLNRHAWQ